MHRARVTYNDGETPSASVEGRGDLSFEPMQDMEGKPTMLVNSAFGMGPNLGMGRGSGHADVFGLTLHPAVRLVEQHARVVQRVALAGRAGREQHRRTARGLTDAPRRDLGADRLHRVVDREQRRHVATGRVDVQRDVALRVLRL